MDDRLIVLDGGDPSPHIERAAAILDGGGVVVFPTETVYGVAARADHPEGMRRLRDMKGRTDGKPFTVHIGRREDVAEYAGRVSGTAARLIRKGWPGPLTLLLEVPEDSRVVAQWPASVAAELYSDGLIGLRLPDDPIAEALLREVAGPIVASSANPAGAPPPYSVDGLGVIFDQVDLILDAGPTRLQQSSTIVRIGEESWSLIREAVYDRKSIELMNQLRILFVCTGNTCRSPMAEVLCRKLIAERLHCAVGELEDRGVRICSAGTFGGGGGASENAVAVMKERGLDLSGHRSQPLRSEMIRSSDHVFAMTQSHFEMIESIADGSVDHIQLLSPDGDISDPFGADQTAYERCADQIEAAIRLRLDEVKP